MISVGDLLRAEVKKGSTMGKKISENMQAYNFVED